MPFNGANVFNTLIEFVDGTDATAEDQNAQDSDLAAGLSDCMTRDGQGSATANIPLGGFRLTELGAPVADTDAVNKAYVTTQIAPTQGGLTSVGVSTGTGDAILLAFTPPITALVTGMRLTFRSTAPNLTSNVVCTVDANTQFPVFSRFGPLSPFDIPIAGVWPEFIFDQALGGGTGGFFMVPIQTAEPGTIRIFGMAALPPGWIVANGIAISRTVNANLFAAWGTTYGDGDGSNTFDIPQIGGQALRFWDNGAGVDPARVLGSLQNDQFQSHGHFVSSGIIGGTGGQVNWTASGGSLVAPSNASPIIIGLPNSGNQGSETRGKNIAFNAGIKL